MRVGLVGCILVVVLSFSPVQLLAKGNGQFLSSVKNRVYHAVKGIRSNTVVDKVIPWQKLIFGAGIVVTCFGASCSSTIERGTVQQGQLSQADIVGQHVHAIVDGQSYLGYVSQANSIDELVLSLYSGEELVVALADVSGTVYQMHEDLGKSVFSPPVDIENELMVATHGLVTSVYSDGYYQVMVGAWLDVFGDINILDNRFSIVVRVDDLEFLTED